MKPADDNLDTPSPSPADVSSLWARPAGYRDVLQLAVPLVLMTGSWSIQHFVDRTFLSWYDPSAMAASFMAGMTFFTIVSFFLGTVVYANTFVAQYHGAGRPERIGPAMWQAIHFAAMAGLLLPFLGLVSRPIFALMGHEPLVQDLESRYFRIVALGGFFILFNNAAATFFTGRGRVWPVAFVNLGITALNIALDPLLIFGLLGFREMGLEGAAWATNIANGAGSIAYVFLVFRKSHDRIHAVRRGWRFDRELFLRLMHFGLPSGGQFLLDMLAFNFFAMLVGRIGTRELEATTLGFQINTLAFLPTLGFGMATATLVGQWLGRDTPRLAARATWSAFHLTCLYMGTIALLYVTIPGVFIYPFAAKVEPARFEEIRRMATTILYFVAAYSLFDGMNIIFAHALKGAGDTRFVMISTVLLGWLLMVLPTWIACERVGHGIFSAWVFLSLYIIVLGLVFLARFFGGKWKAMRVIERPVAGPAAAGLPDVPISEIDM